MRFGTHNSKLLRPPYSRISSPLYTFPGPYPLFPHSSYEATTTLHVTHTYTVLYHRRGISLDKRPSPQVEHLPTFNAPTADNGVVLRETLYRVLCFPVTETAQLFFHRVFQVTRPTWNAVVSSAARIEARPERCAAYIWICIIEITLFKLF